MANDIKGITVKIGADTTDLSKAMSSANRSISTTQKQLNEVQKALMALILVIADLYKNNEDFRNNIQIIWNSIKEILSTVLTEIQTNFSFVWDAVKVIVETALNLIVAATQLFADIFSGNWENIGSDITNIVTVLKDGILSLFTVLKDGILNLITKDLVILHQRLLHSLVVLFLVEQLQVDYIESENLGMMQNHRKVHSSPLIMQRDVLHQIQDTLSLMKTEES